MNKNRAYISIFNDVYRDKWDSFLYSIRNVDEEMLNWVPDCYSFDLHNNPGWPLNGSILWLCNHIIANKVNYYQTVVDLHDRTNVGYQPTFTINEIIEKSNVSHDDFIKKLIELDKEDFNKVVCSDGMNLERFLNNAIRHEAWHSGQIVVIKRLFKFEKSKTNQHGQNT
jgi:hypothetical protein